MHSLRPVLFDVLLLGQLNVLIDSSNFKLSTVAFDIIKKIYIFLQARDCLWHRCNILG